MKEIKNMIIVKKLNFFKIPRKTKVKFLILAMLIAMAGSVQCCKDDDSKRKSEETKKEDDALKKRIEELEKN